MGIASRRTADQWIKQGRIEINGQVIHDLGHKLNPAADQVVIDGRLVEKKQPPRVYWLLNKPDMTLTAATDESKPTIFDLPKLKNLSFKVSPVGRLDFRTEGLLLLSNDGDFVHRMTHPAYKVPRHYLALINGKLSREQLHMIRDSLVLDDGPVKKIEIRHAEGKRLGATKGSWYFVTVYEGRNRLVRRVFEHFDFKVVRLIRDGFGELRLPEDLKSGEYRQLTKTELLQLKRSVGLVKKSNQPEEEG